jgi:hypothetical protein
VRDLRKIVEQVGRHAQRVTPEQAVKETVRTSRRQQRPIGAQLGQVFDPPEARTAQRRGIQVDALDLDVTSTDNGSTSCA